MGAKSGMISMQYNCGSPKDAGSWLQTNSVHVSFLLLAFSC
jgi:hypothetical protein